LFRTSQEKSPSAFKHDYVPYVKEVKEGINITREVIINRNVRVRQDWKLPHKYEYVKKCYTIN